MITNERESNALFGGSCQCVGSDYAKEHQRSGSLLHIPKTCCRTENKTPCIRSIQVLLRFIFRCFASR
jgi:hypothetical protein